MLKVIKSSKYFMFLIKSLLACLGAPSTYSSSTVEPEVNDETTRPPSTIGLTRSGPGDMVAAAKHFSAAHKGTIVTRPAIFVIFKLSLSEMTKSSNHHEEDEQDDAEDVAAGTDTSSHRDGKSAEQKPSNYRSKHSETEQRRRNKINERFQILRELVPPNDQKRDKASLLLEVIEYIQFLQEKLQVYEGSYQQVWHQDPTKLTPWRFSNGPVDNFGTHPQLVRNGSLDEDNVAKQVRSTHGSMESELSGEFAYRGVDLLTGPTTPAGCFGVPFQSCGSVPSKSILPNENLVSQPHFSSIAQSSVLGDQGRACEGSSNSISSAYSQRVLRNLTQALQTSGVDLSQANISVELDIGKRETIGSVAIATAEGVADRSPTSQLKSHLLDIDASAKESVQAVKRFRTGES
ncbi:hypothetical protein KSS87_021764 [Heliosperma pusillum]|nr:hypothetical protein KSS87_021764 [Heliosperma pusillum]